MRSFLLLVALFVLGQSTVLESLDVTSETIIGEATKLKNAKEIFDAIKDSDFVKTVKGVSKWGLPLLQSLNCFAKVIMGNFKSDSKELTYMKEQFKIINDKMDFVDHEFEAVKLLIDWNVIKIQYTKYEIAINVIQEKIQTLTDAPKNIKEMISDDFIRSYEQLYQNAAENIYNGFVNSNTIFSDNLIIAIKKYTKDHRFKIEEFFMGNIQLIFKALEVETFYLNLKNFSGIETYWQSKWEKNFKTLTDLMTEVVDKVTENWGQQWKLDIEEYSVNNYQKSHEEYANGLYSMLNDKFRHRNWLVLVYEPLNSGTNHAFKMCNGESQIEHRGHNILVSSIDKTTDYNLSGGYYANVCNKLPRNLLNWKHGPAHDLMMNKLHIGCDQVKFAAIVRSKSTKVYLAPQGHVTTCRWSGYYNKFVDIHKTFDIIVMG